MSRRKIPLVTPSLDRCEADLPEMETTGAQAGR
jgi:hypothetical protein